jgi:uncharacterized membrane protein
MAQAQATSPLDRLKTEAGGLAEAFAQRAVSSARDKLESTAGRLADYAEDGGGAGLTAALTGAKDLAEGKSPARSLLGAGMAGLKQTVSGLTGGGKGGGKGSKKLKLTNIVESIDVGVPVRVAYDQWTQFADFSTFMKKVENVEQSDDEKLTWKAQVFWSHRTWEATILEQAPEDKIVWRSKGNKGHVDGAVTFHELAPNLTRIVVVLEYYPQGLFERTGNLWRAQGRRARLELKHFQRHVMVDTILHPDDLEGWRGVISDGEVVKDHQTALEEEQSGDGDAPEDQANDLEADDEDRPDDEDLPDDEVSDEGEDLDQDAYDERDDGADGEAGQDPEDEPDDEPVRPRSGRARAQRKEKVK